MRLGAALEASGVRWAILRGEIDRPTDGDLDVLVHPDDAAAFDAGARRAGFTHLPAWGHGHHRFHLGRGTGGWWRLDAVDRLRFSGGQELGPDIVAGALARRGPGPVPQLAADDAASALALHLLLDRSGLRDGDQARASAALTAA